MIKLVRPSFEIISFPEDILKNIEIAARTCYKSEHLIKEGSSERLLKHLIDRDHLAMLEFADIHVKLKVSRGISHELVRHRHCSFAQSSQRYINYKDHSIEFIIPHWVHSFPEANYKESFRVHSDPLEYDFFYCCMESALNYKHRVGGGQKPEDARGCLINDVATEINVKTNVRDWLHIFKLRRSSKSHPDMQLIMNMLYEEFNNRCPIIFK